MSDKNDNINSNQENINDKSENKKENKNIEDKNIQQSEKNQNTGEIDSIKYTILKEDYPVYDLSFKVIIIGDSGKNIFI